MLKFLRKTVPILLAMSLLLIACSGPNNSEIETAVKKALEGSVPVRLVGNLMGGRKATVTEVRVIEVGSAQGEGTNRYWPVKVYASGSCDIPLLGRSPFQGETVFNVYKNSFDKWKANHPGPFSDF